MYLVRLVPFIRVFGASEVFLRWFITFADETLSFVSASSIDRRQQSQLTSFGRSLRVRQRPAEDFSGANVGLKPGVGCSLIATEL